MPRRKLIETPETAEPKENPAYELLRVKQQKEADARQAEIDRRNAESIFFIHCPRGVGHHAAYLTETPPNRIEPRHWYSVHKPSPEDGWDTPFIPCQECFMSGESREWRAALKPIRQADGQYHFSIAAPAKHVFGQVRRDEYEARLRRVSLTEPVKTEPAPTMGATE